MARDQLPDDATLADRVRRTGQQRHPLPCHVWVDGGPGVLIAWERGDGQWWGRVLHIDGEGGAESLISADRIRPAETSPRQ